MLGRNLSWLGMLALIAQVAGCDAPVQDLPGPGATMTLSIGGKALEVELALDDIARAAGLTGRDTLAENAGMLFVYRNAGKQGVSMRQISLPLSVAFISDDGEIVQIEALKPHDERATSSKTNVRYALETNRGWFEKNGVAVGSTVDDFDAVKTKLQGMNVR